MAQNVNPTPTASMATYDKDATERGSATSSAQVRFIQGYVLFSPYICSFYQILCIQFIWVCKIFLPKRQSKPPHKHKDCWIGQGFEQKSEILSIHNSCLILG